MNIVTGSDCAPWQAVNTFYGRQLPQHALHTSLICPLYIRKSGNCKVIKPHSLLSSSKFPFKIFQNIRNLLILSI